MLFGLALILDGLSVGFEYDGRDYIETWPFPFLVIGPFTKSHFWLPPYNPESSDYVL
jgi:hypothetical protein